MNVFFSVLVAGVRERDAVGDPRGRGVLRPGGHGAHLPAHERHGVLGAGRRDRLHPDVPAARLRALLHHLQRLRRRHRLPGGLRFAGAVWGAPAGTPARHPFPRMHPGGGRVRAVLAHPLHLHAGVFRHHPVGFPLGISALRQRTAPGPVGRLSG